MKAVILAGGYGTRITEETIAKPKPMIEIGGVPILVHIMNIYSYHGISDFIICLGYKQTVIKDYFSNYFLYMSDVTFDFKNNTTSLQNSQAKPWRVTLVDTGENTMTGGRLKRIFPYVKDEEAFCMTYGDGVSDIDIHALIRFHKSHKLLATVTAITPPARFGRLVLEKNKVREFNEKPAGEGGNISGGFFVLSPRVIDYIKDDTTVWENEPLKQLTNEGQLAAYSHTGFWQSMDTLRDKLSLEELVAHNKAPWIRPV
jgi:glucose-1-phosphate cytidylyltransferase